MKWYYAANREKLGPIDETAFEQLVKSGIIADNTLVWRKGMPQWEPYAKVRDAAALDAEPEPPTAIPLPVTQADGSTPAEPAPPPPAPVVAPSSESKAEALVCVSCGQTFSLLEMARFGDSYVCQSCRPAFVEKNWDAQDAKEGSDESARHQSLKHERRIRTAAVMYYFVAGLFVLIGVLSPLNGNMGALFLLPMAVGIFLAARELFQIRRRAKLAAGIVSGLGLLMFPIGTIIHGIVLYFVFSKEGRRVISEEHRGVIERTPEIKCPVSKLGAVLFCVAIFLSFAASGG